LVTGISAGTCVITYTDNTDCSTNADITVTDPVVPLFDGVGPYCSGETIPDLPTTSSNGINGTWSPTINNSATTTYTFTPSAGQCATTAILTITINPTTTPAFLSVGPYCAGATIPALPTTSTNGITGTWSPSINNTATTTYTFTPTAGLCATTATLTITINQPVIPTFSSVGPYCDGATIPALPTTSTNGINGTWSPTINNSATATYTFTPSADQCATTTTLTITINPIVTPTFTAVGPYCAGVTIPALPITSTNGITGTWSPTINNSATTTYTFTPSAGQCATTATLTITINPNITPAFSSVGPYCAGATIPALPTTSTNGITGTWNPSINNTATTTYTFTPTAGLCATTATLTITINQPVIPTFSSVGPYCSGATIPALPTTSINGITGTWSPTINNSATTTYTFTPSAGQCATNTTLTITINPIVTPTFSAVGPYCAGATIPPLPTRSTNGITGTWSPSINNNSTTTYTFTPSAGQCATTATLTITINPNIAPAFSSAGPYCAGATIPALPLTSTNGITGTWSPSINNSATTTYTFTPSAGQCATTATLTITINPNITPAFSSAGPYCAGATIPALPTTSTNGITGTWSPSINNSATTTYTFTPSAGQCATTATLTITINPNITPAFSSVGPYCAGTTIPALPTTSTNGITGTWSPSINNSATTTYTFTPSAGQCATTTTLTITVNETPTAPSVGTITQPTCAVATGSVVLSGLPASGSWTITSSPDGTTTTGTGTSTTIVSLADGITYSFTVTTSDGCTSASTSNVVINDQPETPSVPTIGTVTQPTCTVATGSIVINGLPSAGSWILTRSPNGTSITETGTSISVSGLIADTYSFTVTNSAGCVSGSTENVVINAQPVTPTAPEIGTITQPTCTVATGSVILNGLPAEGTWTLSRAPDGTTTTGTGTTATISELDAGTYIFTVTNASGCTSALSGNVVINVQPPTPTAPVVGTITHPTCTSATGSVILNGLPSSGTWTLTRTPGDITTTGTGTGTTISGLAPGTYSYTVINASGCISESSGNVIINTQPITPTAPIIGTITQPTYNIPTGSVILNGLPSSGAWTLTRNPGGITTAGSGISITISGLAPGTYTFMVTNASGCISPGSAVVGLYTLELFGPGNTVLRARDTLKIDDSGPGTFLLSVESNANWTVNDNSLWLKAVRETGTSNIKVTYLENISVFDKIAALSVTYTLNPEMVVYVRQKGRVSHLDESKFNNVQLYPNPAGDFVYLKFGEAELTNIKISTTNIQGFLISEKEYQNITPGQIIELNVSELTVGKYFIRIRDNSGQKIFHMIKY
jgi:serine protease inhibitor